MHMFRGVEFSWPKSLNSSLVSEYVEQEGSLRYKQRNFSLTLLLACRQHYGNHNCACPFLYDGSHGTASVFALCPVHDDA